MRKKQTESYILHRILAGIIDYSIIFGFTLFLLYLIGEPNDEGGVSITGAPSFIPIIFWLIMTVGIESWFGGTLGNSIVGIKAIPSSGKNRKLTFGESFKRHLLDPIDMSFCGLTGIIVIRNTSKNQRIGDLWAKTIVVPIKSLTELDSE